MKILIADKFPDKYINILKDKGYIINFVPSLKEDDLYKSINDNEILIVRSTKVNRKTIDSAKSLKLIIRAGSGYNTIDFEYASEKGIAVANCPGTNSIAVAELTMGLMLALDRRIYHNVRDLRDKKWNKKEYSKADGIFGKTLGIIGIGHIGKEISKRAIAFGMKLVGYDPYISDDEFEKYCITKYDDIYKLAENSDVITVHLPENEKTKKLFNNEFFSHMKEGAYFINTSRGGIVDQKALIDATQNKNIRVGLDVYENEPDANDKEFNDEITQIENIYGTHHIGASSEQAQNAVADMVIDIIFKFEKTGIVINKVN